MGLDSAKLSGYAIRAEGFTEETVQDEQKKIKDIRFCPYCAQISFDVIDRDEEGYVYCEVCGVDIPIKELIQ